MTHLNFLAKLFDFSELKVQVASFYGLLISSFLTLITTFTEGFLGISASIFLLLFLVMITDFVTGIRSAKKEGQVLRSKRGLGWVFKYGSYMVFLAVSFSLRKEIICYGFDLFEMPFKLIHFYILMHIFYWELKSVDENFERLGYSFRILKITDNIFDFLKGIMTKKIGS